MKANNPKGQGHTETTKCKMWEFDLKKTLKYWWSKNIFLSKNSFFVLLTDLAYCLRNIGTEWFWLTGIRSHGQMCTQDTDIKCYTNSCIPGKFSFVRKSIMTVSSPNHIMCVWCHHLNHVICVWLVQTIASPEQINLSKNPTIGRVMNMIGGSRMNLHCIDLLIRHFGQATKRRQSVFLFMYHDPHICLIHFHLTPSSINSFSSAWCKSHPNAFN